MPIEVRRFGVGQRRAEGPAGNRGVEGRVIHSDGRGLVAELAIARRGRIEAHTNPNSTWLCVIEGGGFVEVGGERRRVAAGEAVLWPADVPHGAWTEDAEMRAIVVEFAGRDDVETVVGRARRIAPGEIGQVARGDGQLTAGPPNPPAGSAEGEPR